VRQLRATGWLVVGISRRPSEADETEECDVSDRPAVDAVAARVLARHPTIGLLVCNAGYSTRSTFLDGRPEQVEQVMRVNYLGSLWTVQAFLPGLGRGSHIATVVSVAGTVADGPYSASKHAQLALSRSLAVELAPRGVMVHTVNPGLIETPGFHQRQSSARSARGSSSTRRSSPRVCSARSSTIAGRSSCPAGTGRSRGCRHSRREPWRACERYARVSRNQPSVAR
jgi:NAD(P)-dependent dehydrogenase (short-subunit alcohol dehydrogenase family)